MDCNDKDNIEILNRLIFLYINYGKHQKNVDNLNIIDKIYII